ncbi:FUSC family protein [Larkinella arboricola]
MNTSVMGLIRQEVKTLFELKKTERLWHIPFLVCLGSGIPLLVGWYLGNMAYGALSSLGGLVILHMPPSSLTNRMITLLACSFGFMISFAIGVCFSFNPYVSAFVFGIFSFCVHWVVTSIRLKPPRSFFFIMIASMASCMPFHLETIPERIGLLGIGTMIACFLAFVYSLLLTYKKTAQTQLSLGPISTKIQHTDLIESGIVGIFLLLSLLIGHWLELKNPYWIPVSCAAVMQGVSLRHVWQRSFHRILGTLIGLGLCWGLLLVSLTPLILCISIIVLQFVIEMLVLRHYALAVIFITPMTILLTEAGSVLSYTPSELIFARFIDITLGSLLGSLGGWFIYHEQLRAKAHRQLRKARVLLKRW